MLLLNEKVRRTIYNGRELQLDHRRSLGGQMIFERKPAVNSTGVDATGMVTCPFMRNKFSGGKLVKTKKKKITKLNSGRRWTEPTQVGARLIVSGRVPFRSQSFRIQTSALPESEDFKTSRCSAWMAGHEHYLARRKESDLVRKVWQCVGSKFSWDSRRLSWPFC